MQFQTFRCPLCGGCSHPATGCVYTQTFVVCWRCTLAGARFVQHLTRSKGRRRGLAFYDHVGPPAAIGRNRPLAE